MTALEDALDNLSLLGMVVIEMIEKAEIAKHSDITDPLERKYQQGRADALRSILPYVQEYTDKQYHRRGR